MKKLIAIVLAGVLSLSLGAWAVNESIEDLDPTRETEPELEMAEDSSVLELISEDEAAESLSDILEDMKEYVDGLTDVDNLPWLESAGE